MTKSDNNPATETFQSLQRKSAAPMLLAIVIVAMIANDASIWMFPIVLGVAGVYFFAVLGGARLGRRPPSR